MYVKGPAFTTASQSQRTVASSSKVRQAVSNILFSGCFITLINRSHHPSHQSALAELNVKSNSLSSPYPSYQGTLSSPNVGPIMTVDDAWSFSSRSNSFQILQEG